MAKPQVALQSLLLTIDLETQIQLAAVNEGRLNEQNTGTTVAKFILVKNEMEPDIKRFPIEQFNVPTQLSEILHLRDFRFQAPTEWLNWLIQACAGVPPDIILWLELSPGCGYLDLVDWEQLLVPMKRPIIHRPEVPEPQASENRAILDVVLCGSSPIAKGELPIVEYFVQCAKQLFSNPARALKLHIFTDERAFDDLNEQLNRKFSQDKDQLARIVTYDPKTAVKDDAATLSYEDERKVGRIRNPWLLWMREALKATTVDVLHFINHGFLSGERGALAFAESPQVNQNQDTAQFIYGGELALLANHIGAWSIALTSPQTNYSRFGLRRLMSELARRRPGPLLLHDAQLDPAFSALADGYRFIYGVEPTPPPRSTALTMYCTPQQIMTPELCGTTEERLFGVRLPMIASDNMRILSHSLPPETRSAWISASERVIENLENSSLKIDKALESIHSISRSSVEPYLRQRVLSEVSSKVRDILRKYGSSGADPSAEIAPEESAPQPRVFGAEQ